MKLERCKICRKALWPSGVGVRYKNQETVHVKFNDSLIVIDEVMHEHCFKRFLLIAKVVDNSPFTNS